MLKITIITEEHNYYNMALEVELISQLIIEGKTEGRGWKIEGSPEKEKELPIEDLDETLEELS